MLMHNTRMARTIRAGFTLMEVLVVVAILVILAGTGGVIYMNQLENAKVDLVKSQVQTLTQQAETYAIRNGGVYPPNLAVLTQQQPDGTGAILEPAAIIDPWGQQYMYMWPGQHHMQTNKPDIWSNGPPGGTTGQLGNWKVQNQGR